MRILAPIAIALTQLVYRLMWFAPQRRKVVLFSRQSNTPSRDFRMLADEIARSAPDVEVIMRCRAIPSSIIGRVLYVGEVLAQMHHLATARVCVVDGYIVPVSLLTHRPGLTVIQMWHALGAIKRFGLQALDLSGGRSAEMADAMRMHRNYDLVLCGGDGSVPSFAEAFGVPMSAVAVTGLPRVDYLVEEDGRSLEAEPPAIAELRRRYPTLADADRIRVLYAPTFRRGRALAFDDVIRAFHDDRCTLIVKPHQLDVPGAYADNVVDASGIDALDLLLLADVVITDYSAIAFEAATIDRPAYFFVPDIDEYREDHGLNIEPLEEMGEVSSRDIADIRGWILDGRGHAPDTARFRDRYLLRDEDCTRRIAALVVSAAVGDGLADA